MALAAGAAPLPWQNAAVWLLAAVLLATGLGKALDVVGFAQVLAAYGAFPPGSEGVVAVSVTLLELGLAAALLVPGWRRLAAGGALLLFMGNAALLTVTLLRGIDLANCGCFGVFLARPLRPWTPLEDIALAMLAMLARGR
jgi:uncharacterized membrane protein YphA (DoxX/SURF4 family)